MSRKKLLAITLTAVLTTATLAGCADAGETGTPAPQPPAASSATTEDQVSTTHNDADTEFAQMMIVHHQGAIEMADLAISKGDDPAVVALGEQISKAQGPEIDTMTSWLTAWDEPVAPSGHAGMDHGGMDMNGMSQEEMMASLAGLSGPGFDKAFLEGMIAHHQGAVEMAQALLNDGESPEALDLAKKIIADQEAEITEMQEMLAG